MFRKTHSFSLNKSGLGDSPSRRFCNKGMVSSQANGLSLLICIRVCLIFSLLIGSKMSEEAEEYPWDYRDLLGAIMLIKG